MGASRGILIHWSAPKDFLSVSSNQYSPLYFIRVFIPLSVENLLLLSLDLIAFAIAIQQNPFTQLC